MSRLNGRLRGLHQHIKIRKMVVPHKPYTSLVSVWAILTRLSAAFAPGEPIDALVDALTMMTVTSENDAD